MHHAHRRFWYLFVGTLTLGLLITQTDQAQAQLVNGRLPTLKFATPKKMPMPYYVQSVSLSPDGKRLACFGSEMGQRAPNNFAFLTAMSVIDLKSGTVLYKDRPTPPNNQGARGTTSGGFRYLGAFSPDGKRLAWGATNREHAFYFRNERGIIKGLDKANAQRRLGTSACFSPDGKTLATGQYSPAKIFLWNAKTGEKIKEITPAVAQVSALQYSPDGKYLACADRRNYFLIMDAETGRTHHKITNSSITYPGMRFSPDGKILAASGSTGTALWDVENKRLIKRISGVGYTVAFSPDGRFLAIGNQTSIQLWDSTGQYKLADLPLGTRVQTMVFSPDGEKLYVPRTLSNKHEVWVWNLRPTGIANGPTTPPSKDELTRLWDGLQAETLAKAYPSLLLMAASPRESVAFLKAHLEPEPMLSRATRVRIQRLIATLNSPRFQSREEAVSELVEFGRPVVPFLRTVRKASPSPRMNKQLDLLITKLGSRLAEEDQAVRAVQVLELANGPDARAILQSLSRGEPTAPLTREATAALKRLGG